MVKYELEIRIIRKKRKNVQWSNNKQTVNYSIQTYALVLVYHFTNILINILIKIYTHSASSISQKETQNVCKYFCFFFFWIMEFQVFSFVHSLFSTPAVSVAHVINLLAHFIKIHLVTFFSCSFSIFCCTNIW